MSTSYDAIRTSVISSGTDSRVEVNQRALIDKILARYASAGAVYRELLQNSNDAEAKTAQIRFTTSDTSSGPRVTQVVYRNDGLPFRPQDWSRLRKIAEGNPDVSKVGAFGVGAYTMFSICEEPLVISDSEALAFAWKGDALWTNTGPSPHPPDQWTTFVLPSRDPYPLPNLVEFGQFLCSSLTFTQCLCTLTVFIDDVERLTVSKKQLRPPTIMTPPKASSWWSNDGAVTHSPKRIFSLGRTDGSMMETIVQMTASLDGDVASITARYISAVANVNVPADMARKMYRVTKKKPPKQVNIQLFVDAAAKRETQKKSRAHAILDAFSPGVGTGKVFIGFKTSQTTGLAAHLAAPLVPTVEREAIDFQDPSLKIFNCELLSIAGVLLRLTLEHSMSLIGKRWEETKDARLALEEKLKSNTRASTDSVKQSSVEDNRSTETTTNEKPKERGGLLGFASFMSSGVRKLADMISSVDLRGDDDDDLLNPADPRPLSEEEEDAIMIMRAFCPQQSTPDSLVGSVIADGFVACMSNVSPPVLTNSGVLRSSECRLPLYGIERFAKEGVVRRVVHQNAETYMKHVAGCSFLGLRDLENALGKRPLNEDDLVTFLRWWTKFCRMKPDAISQGPRIKKTISFTTKVSRKDTSNGTQEKVFALDAIRYFADEKMFSEKLPVPECVLPRGIQERVTQRLLADRSLVSWFSSLPFNVWALFICKHPCLTEGRHVDANVRLLALSALCKEHSSKTTQSLAAYERWLQESLSRVKCIPHHSHVPGPLATDFPEDLYLSSAELDVFEGLGSFRKVSPELPKSGITDTFLVVLGVRKAISIDFLFTQLDNLKWSGDPKPLISYLRTAALTKHDMEKLRTTKYLPAKEDKSQAYAPPELHLPNPPLAVFPFVKTLHWPSGDEVSARSQEGKFLIQLGCRVDPDLKTVLTFLTNHTTDAAIRIKMLSFVSERVRPGGVYEHEYASSSSLSSSSFLRMKFLPAIRQDPLEAHAPREELQAPEQCFNDPEVLCMGFAVVDPVLQKKEGKAIGERFLCKPRPAAERLVHQLLSVVSFAKKKLAQPEFEESAADTIAGAFKSIFDYLSTRTKEFNETMIHTLKEAPFIPCQHEGKIQWFRPGDVFFKNVNLDTAALTSALFLVVEFNPFLAAVGVGSEPSLKDLLQLVVSTPEVVLDKLGGEVTYKALLRRIAAHPPHTKSSSEMRNSAFLLAYRSEEGDVQNSGDCENVSEVKQYELAKATDICIIDNSFFARMFNVLSAPPESDLERFYATLGSQYISERVQQKFKVVGGRRQNTKLTSEFMARIQERKPLLVSQKGTSRKLRPNAASLLGENYVDIHEVDGINATYILDDITRHQDITCCASVSRNRSVVCISKEFDWFDVGSAIGHVILERCRLEDSFFIGSLLEAPLKQLRARGFPVDRILASAQPAVRADSKAEASGNQPQRVEDHLQQNSTSREQGSPRPAQTASSVSERDGYASILKQMFPGCSEEHIISLLGRAPTLETLRQVADSLTDGYPKEEGPKKENKQAGGPHKSDQKSNDSSLPQASSGASGPKTPTALEKYKEKAKRAATFNPLALARRGMKNSLAGNGLFSNGGSARPVDPNEAISPRQLTASNKSFESMLNDSIRSSRKVSPEGITSQEAVMTSVPEGVQHSGDGCEVVPGHSLKPLMGRNGSGKTANGIRVFSSLRDRDSEQYLDQSVDIVEAFSVVLQTICRVYSLRLDCVAIFREVTGGTIAFNSSGALYFNVRFFADLHWKGRGKKEMSCYSYWFTTMAHELAHNFVAPHNKEHGCFTERYVTLFLPRLIEVMR